MGTGQHRARPGGVPVPGPETGTLTHGDFVVTTRDGQRRVGTTAQGRWGLLVSEYDAGEVCSALSKWIAWVEQEETSRGVPSVQLFKDLKTALALDGIYGCCPFVAPSSFQRSISDWIRAEGCGQRLPSARPLYNLLCFTAPEQWHMCRDLRSDQEWYALTRSGTLGSQTKALLLRTGSAITVFRRGTRAAAVKGGWRQAKLGAVKTDAEWTLWASHGAAGSAEAQAAQLDAAWKWRFVLVDALCFVLDKVHFWFVVSQSTVSRNILSLQISLKQNENLL